MSHHSLKKIRARYRKVYGTDPVIVDAKTPLRIAPLPCDEKGADKFCPDDCLFEHAGRRQHQAKAMVVFKETMYIDLVNAKGEVEYARFSIPLSTRKAIAAFDAGKPLAIGAAFIFLPPSEKHTLEGIRKSKRKWRQTKAGKAFYAVGNALNRVRIAEGQSTRAAERFAEVRRDLPASSAKVVEARGEAKTAREKLQTARVDLESERQKAAKVKVPREKKRRIKPRTFDLGTRNFANGNYHFKSLGERRGSNLRAA